VGRPRVLPSVSADEFFASTCIAQNRPPWTATGSTELARLLDINPQSLWNWSVRRTGPAAEPRPELVYRGIGRAKLVAYRLDKVLAWLDAEARPAWRWSHRFLVEWFRWPEDAELPAVTPAATLAAIEDLENQSWSKLYHRWRPWRSVEAGLARLREDYQPPALAA
jgi:hypothetical protein